MAAECVRIQFGGEAISGLQCDGKPQPRFPEFNLHRLGATCQRTSERQRGGWGERISDRHVAAPCDSLKRVERKRSETKVQTDRQKSATAEEKSLQ